MEGQGEVASMSVCFDAGHEVMVGAVGVLAITTKKWCVVRIAVSVCVCAKNVYPLLDLG